ncbi:MAG: DUF99 family protein [Deltaproteobacteria bacterium]|nr:DUF99 family protein [Deltaproteobacteria bacterium]
MIKPGVRTIGIDDGPFDRSRRGDVLVVGAIYRGGTDFDGLLTTKVRKDGWNATDRIVSMLEMSKFLPQLHYIILDGIALGGFNIIDIERLHQETGLKILVAVRKKPNLEAVKRALGNLTRPEERWNLLRKAGDLHHIENLHCQLMGMNVDEARELLALTCTRSHVPESLRAAHLIAGGIVFGQSGRRA